MKLTHSAQGLFSRMSVLLALFLPISCAALGGGAPGDEDSDPDDPDVTGDGDGDMMDPPLSRRCEASTMAPAGLRRLTALELQRSIEDIFPSVSEQWGGVALGADPVGISGYTTDSRTLVVGPQSAEEIFRTALDVATLIASSSHLPTILPCSVSAADSACAGTFVDTFGPRIYRRPLEPAERAEVISYFDSVLARADFPMALKWTLVTLLQSPSFVYRSELGDDAGNLSPHEVAAQLSYTFSGSTPTEELMTRAQAGELETPESRIEEARALLMSESGQQVINDFLKQWSGYEEVRGVAKDGIDNFAEVREAMVEETRRFLVEAVVTSGGDVKTLLTAPYTFTNDVLAAHYGFGSAGATFEKQDRPAGRGIGILAQGSILSAKAHPDITSPVFRGLLVFEKLLCGEPPPVPDAVPAIEEAPPANTTRERFELSHGSGPCRTCHEAFEPYGFALESFDAAGRFRENENGFEIDTAAMAETPSGSELSFDGLEDLAQKLAQDPLVTDCVSGQVVAYAFSGGAGEVCLAEEQRTALSEGAIGLLEYYAELAAAPSMTRRARP